MLSNITISKFSCIVSIADQITTWLHEIIVMFPISPYFPGSHCSPVIGSVARLIICLSRVWPASGKINLADNSTRLTPGWRFINVQNSPQNAMKINKLCPLSLLSSATNLCPGKTNTNNKHHDYILFHESICGMDGNQGQNFLNI